MKNQHKPLRKPVIIIVGVVVVLAVAAAIIFGVVFSLNPKAQVLSSELDRIGYTSVGKIVYTDIKTSPALRTMNTKPENIEDVVQWDGNVFNPTVARLRARGYACTINRAFTPPSATCTRKVADRTFRAAVTFFDTSSQQFGEEIQQYRSRTTLTLA